MLAEPSMSTLSAAPPSMLIAAMPALVEAAKITATQVPVKVNVAVALVCPEYLAVPPELRLSVQLDQLPLYATAGSVSWKVVPLHPGARTALAAWKPSRKIAAAPEEAFFVPDTITSMVWF